MGSLTVVSGLFEEFEEIRFQYVSTIKVGRHYAHHSPPLLYAFSEKLNSEHVHVSENKIFNLAYALC